MDFYSKIQLREENKTRGKQPCLKCKKNKLVPKRGGRVGKKLFYSGQ